MKNTKILVSVLIANYNNAKFIKDCIKSVKKQTYTNIEIIFFDDCSEDNSINEIKKFPKIKVIGNNKRGKFGSFNQMNAYVKAFKESRGDIIFLLDSDDFFSKEKISYLVNIFVNNNKISAIFDLPIFKYDKKLEFKKNKKSLIKNFWPYIPPQSCISIRKKDFEKALKKINFKLFPDIWMDFRMALYLKYISRNFFILNKNLTYYRQSAQMVSSNFKYLSISWWKRRMQAHYYVKYFFLKHKISYKKNFDYFLTFFINNLI